MAGSRREYRFRVQGSLQADANGPLVRMAAQRAAGDVHELRAVDGQDIVLLQIADGPLLRLHPATAAALLQADDSQRSAGPADDGVVDVSPSLSVPGSEASRGVFGRVLVAAVQIFKPQLAGATALALALKLEDQVKPGMHRLPAEGALPSFKAAQPVAAMPASDAPMLVFIHGTFSSTRGTFGKLWDLHPQHVHRLAQGYGGGLWALEHRSVTQSPLQNAVSLLQALPVGARLHLVTHSRGGLVAEVLARAMRSDGAKPFDAADLALLAGPDRSTQRDELRQLNQLIAAKRPRVERVLRVAAPARGTLLASGRLDVYLGVLEWALKAASVPVLPELVDFATAVAHERTDPRVLPGLEAMIPGQALGRVLTREDLRLDSQLRVVAGDIQGDSVLSWLKVLATDAFYLSSHDLVVNTDSMYGGQARVQRPQFVFERGADVSHFRYFSNPSSAQAVVDGLLQDQPPQFQPVGDLSWQGQASDGVRGLRSLRPQVVDTGKRPAVLVLPGIMGSHLLVDRQRVWLDPKAVLLGGLDRLRYPTAQVRPEEPMDDFFGDLMQDLSDTYDVIPFAYDWRIPIEESASLLAQRLDAALDARHGQGLPVRVLAHSMGGLVMRAVQVAAPATWKRFFDAPGARFVMAGTPNRGSYAPMLALSGQHPVVNTVDALDTCTSWRELREMMAGFPGLMQLQMLAGGGEDLSKQTTWQQLETWHRSKPLHPSLVGPDGVGPGKRPWGLPQQDVLTQLATLRSKLDPQLDQLRDLDDKVRLVAGHAEQTVVDLRRSDFGVEFLASGQGDGTVPWDSLRLPGVPCWRVEAEHGDLLRKRDAFGAYRDLLERGETNALPRLEDDATRSAAAATPATPQPWRPLRRPYAPTLAEVRAAALGSGQQLPRAALPTDRAGPSLHIEVINGNLTEVRTGLLVGHYRSSALTGAEYTLDWAVGNLLSQALALGHYPQAQGQVEVYANGKPRNPFAPGISVPTAVIVAGLGDENELTASRLVDVVAQAAMAWSLQVQQHGATAGAPLTLAALLLGSGGWRVNLAQSAQALAQGVCQANRQLDAQKLPVIDSLTVMELYADRASAAHLALADLRSQLPIRLEPRVTMGSGGLQRPTSRVYRGTDYDIVRVQRAAPDAPELAYLVHSSRARSEEMRQHVQPLALQRLVDSTETAMRLDDALSHALFNLLLPVDLRPQLSAAGSLLLDLDVDAAALPWEALRDQRAATGMAPLAVRTSLLRTLRLADYRRQPVDNSAARQVLVIGEPLCDPSTYPPLPGARREAQAVAACFSAKRDAWQVDPPLLNASAEAVFKALYAQAWRVLHVAGHGDYVDDLKAAPGSSAKRGGVVLEDGVFLGADEVHALPTVPELVFVNCCHLGRLAPGIAGSPQAAKPRKMPRSQFAATLAGQLIGIGVRCVVVAGWAVDDQGAETFARELYQQLLSGISFGDAVLRARRRTWEQDPGSSTWAAYQCYGDPKWRLSAAHDDAPPRLVTPPTPARDDLLVALREVRWDTQYRSQAVDGARNLAARLAALESQAGPTWLKEGAVAEAFGDAWSEQGNLARAIDWYVRALAAEDGRATLRAAEQRDNLRARLAADRNDVDAIEQALHALQQRATQAPCSERLALVGSAYKRLALLAARAKQPDRLLVAQQVEAMTQAYAQATAHPGFYARMQLAIGLLMQHLLAGENPQRDDLRDAMLDAHAALQAAQQTEPDFWTRVGDIEWALYRVVAVGELPQLEAAYAAELATVQRLDASPRRWASVRDTLELLARTAQLGGSAAAPALQRLYVQVKSYAAES